VTLEQICSEQLGFPKSVLFHQFFTLTFFVMLVLLEGEVVNGSEPSIRKQYFPGNRNTGKRSTSTSFD
jgi:hypothetical protein